MPISSTTRKTSPFVGDGISTTFAFTFKVFSDTDLYVVKLNTSTDVETVLVLTTNYSVTVNADQNTSPGGTVILTTALPVGYTLTLTSKVANLQPTNLTNQGGFYPTVITDSFDRATIQIQQLQEQVDRAAKIPISSTASSDTLADDIRLLADHIDEIDDVAAIDTEVATVAGISTDVTTAAANVTSISNFADRYYGPNATDPTTRRDGTALQYGDLYFNTASNKMRVYTSAGWEDTGAAVPVTITTQTFNGTGAQVDFNLSSAPAFLNALEVAILGVVQVPTTDYTLSGTTLTFTSAPPSGTANIFCRWYSSYAGGVPNDGSVNADKLASGLAVNGVTLASAAVGFTATGGTSSKTVAFTEDATVSRAGIQALIAKYTSGLINIGLAVTKSAKALTVGLTTETGAPPSAADPCSIVFRSATLATGAPVIANVTSALSVTFPSGSHPGFSAGGAGRIYVWAIYYSSAVELALSRAADLFQEDSLVSTSAISGASSAAVMYSTSARSTVPCRLIGYIEITTGAVVGEWDNDPSKVQIMGPGVRRTGDIIQIAKYETGASATGSTTVPHDDTIPQITEGDEYMTLAVAPTSAINMLIIDIVAIVASSSASLYNVMLFRDAVANALAVASTWQAQLNMGTTIPLTHIMLAGTTSSITLRVRIGARDAGTITLNGYGGNRMYGGAYASSIIVREVMA